MLHDLHLRACIWCYPSTHPISVWCGVVVSAERYSYTPHLTTCAECYDRYAQHLCPSRHVNYSDETP